MNRFVRWAMASALTLIVLAWLTIFLEQGDRLGAFFSAATWRQGSEIVAQFFGAGRDRPAFTNPERWREAKELAYETLRMSVLAIGFAGIGTLLLVIPGARNAADGSLTLTRSRFSRFGYWLARLLFTFARAVPELVWAMLIIFVFSPGILPGAIALGLHNFGILGKLCAEVVEDVDMRPARALRNAGAGTMQTLLYGVLPVVMPQFLSYLLYRWEIIIRTTIVVGFVSAGGLGRQFRLAMSWLHFDEVALILICYLALVLMVDIMSGLLRRLAQ